MAGLEKKFGSEMNTLGTGLSLKEVGRTREIESTLVTYELYATGFPKASTFVLFQVQLDGSISKDLEGISLDGTGLAICMGQRGKCYGDQPNDPIDLVVSAALGEPKRFILLSDSEGHPKAFVSVVPFPNSVTDNGCKLESILGLPNGELVFIRGSGFDPKEELNIDSKSFDEKHHDVVNADASGSYFVAVMPFVVGKRSGQTVWSIKAKKCNPTITFQWGEHSYHLE